MVQAPRVYAKPCLYCLLSILAVLLFNASFLFLPALPGDRNIDYSLFGFSLCAFTFYWNGFSFSSHGLMNYFHWWIFENIDQALVLFDYQDKLILHNRMAEQMLPAGALEPEIRLNEFIQACGMVYRKEPDQTHTTFQCYIDTQPMRCDYSVHLDKRNRRLGRMYVFRKTTTNVDVLTGFRSWSDFQAKSEELFPDNSRQQIVAAFDINSLSDINRKYSNEVGDQVIQQLAEEMKTQFPTGTELVRSYEATLLAVCTNVNRQTVEAHIDRIRDRLEHTDLPVGPVQLQSAISIRQDEPIVDTIQSSLQAIRTKKLMDRTSLHSDILLSLMQALTQCDPETSAHVHRTQKLCKELGSRIGLTDREHSKLALLAILHDIGKIGIPLEILNKPGKLSDLEWVKMKTHVQKGYQIAKNSQELSPIADMILYHHERWDGRGYPEGLSGEQIPLLSRIISVVDTYDAMTNDRVYRKALSESAARYELRRCAGTQFDPHIVKEFLVMLEERDARMGVAVSTMSQQEASDVGAVGNPVITDQDCINVHFVAHSVYVLDSSMRIIEVDQQFETMTGYSMEDVRRLNMTQLDLIFKSDRAEYMALISESRSRSTDIYLEHRIRRKDGVGIYVYCYGHDYYNAAAADGHTRIAIINSDDPFGKQPDLSPEELV